MLHLNSRLENEASTFVVIYELLKCLPKPHKVVSISAFRKTAWCQLLIALRESESSSRQSYSLASALEFNTHSAIHKSTF